MAHRKCFNGVADDLNSGQYISRKKAKTIYKASVDLAQQPIPGVYQKKTSTGQKKGIYVGDINISRGETPASGAAPQQSGCLIGATSYASLSSVTEGKYLVDPINFDIRRTQDMWVGSIYAMDMSGATTLIPYPGASPPYNTFLYPPSSDSNQIYPNYPDPSNNNIGPVVDPCYNIFYPIGVEQSSRGTCYLKNERAYKQYLKCLPYTTEQAKVYAKAQNGYIGDIFYPKKFHFGCDQLWINDISHCLTAELGGRNNRNSSGSGSTVGSTPTITGVNTDLNPVINAEAVESPVYVGVTTSGVEYGQMVTVTLNSKNYTAPVSSNTIVTIPAIDLQALPNGSYTITVNVSNTDGIPAATFTGASFTVDTTKPTMDITSTTVTSGTTTNDLSIAITLTTEEGTTFEQADITLVNGTLSAIAGYGPYTATFTPVANTTGSISVAAGTFQDAYGNLNTISNTFTWTQDTTLPTMTITSTSVADGATTTQALIALTFTSSEATTTFEQADITLVNGTLSAITGSGKVYYATFTPTDDGVCTIDVAANEFTDGYDNYNEASNTFTWTFDGTVIINGTGIFTVDDWTGADSPPAFEIGSGFTSVGASALNAQTSITKVIIGNGVTSIGNTAFNSCSALTTVTFTAGSLLETINNSAFWYCTGLTSIIIPANVTSIGIYVFGGASSLTSITVADGNENYKAIEGVLFTIDETTLHTYPGGKPDSSYIIPDSVTTIGQAAFYTAIHLASVTISTKVETIGVQAFDTTKVASINIPASVSSIGQQAFNTPELTSITVDTSNTHYKAIDGVLFGLNGTTITTLIQYPIGNTRTSYEIPNTVTTIGGYALYRASSLTSVTFQSGSTLKTIGSLAFSIILSMSTIDIPSSVTTIGSNAFQNSGLTEITIPNLVESIGASAFQSCWNLKNVSFALDSALTTSSDIGTNAFESSPLETVSAYSALISNMNWTVSNSTAPPTMNTIGGEEGVTVVELV